MPETGPCAHPFTYTERTERLYGSGGRFTYTGLCLECGKTVEFPPPTRIPDTGGR